MKSLHHQTDCTGARAQTQAMKGPPMKGMCCSKYSRISCAKRLGCSSVPMLACICFLVACALAPNSSPLCNAGLASACVHVELHALCTMHGLYSISAGTLWIVRLPKGARLVLSSRITMTIRLHAGAADKLDDSKPPVPPLPWLRGQHRSQKPSFELGVTLTVTRSMGTAVCRPRSLAHLKVSSQLASN